MIVATWKRDLKGLFNADAQKVAEEIMQIGETATPREIVDKARDENTELHRCFEWRDDVAAEKYSIYQARQVVCSLVFVRQDDPEQTKPEIRVFHKPKDAKGYMHSTKIFRQEDVDTRLLESAMAELRAFKRKYECLTELEEILALID